MSLLWPVNFIPAQCTRNQCFLVKIASCCRVTSGVVCYSEMAILVRLKTEYELEKSAAQLHPSLSHVLFVVFEVMPMFSLCTTVFFYLTQPCRS